MKVVHSKQNEDQQQQQQILFFRFEAKINTIAYTPHCLENMFVD